MKGRLAVDETVTTILLNYVAILFTSYLVNYPFKVPGIANAMSAEVAPAAHLTRFMPGSQFNAGFLIALAAVAVITFLMKRMNLGFELRSVGDNPIFSKWMGMPTENIIEKVMFISGLLGGVAGAVQVLGVHYRFAANFSLGLALPESQLPFWRVTTRLEYCLQGCSLACCAVAAPQWNYLLMCRVTYPSARSNRDFLCCDGN